jgi:hypothetical protein
MRQPPLLVRLLLACYQPLSVAPLSLRGSTLYVRVNTCACVCVRARARVCTYRRSLQGNEIPEVPTEVATLGRLEVLYVARVPVFLTKGARLRNLADVFSLLYARIVRSGSWTTTSSLAVFRMYTSATGCEICTDLPPCTFLSRIGVWRLTCTHAGAELLTAIRLRRARPSLYRTGNQRLVTPIARVAGLV